MKPSHQIAALVIVLGGFVAAVPAQTIFNENFDGGYTGYFSTGSYSGGSPTATNNAVIATGGNPGGAWQETMTATSWSDYYGGMVQLMTVSGNTDPNPSDYVLSFDAKGSQAVTIQLTIQTWPGDYYAGSGPVINVPVNETLAAANTWQTFSINLGSITTNLPIGATWQLIFPLDSWLWNGPGFTDTLTIDNIKLVNIGNPIALTSSFNPSSYGGGVTFTATVLTNGTTAGDATGQVVFSSASGPFSTNTVTGGSATSSPIANLPAGTDLITATYSGGNHPGSANTLNQLVATAPGIAQNNLSIYTDNLVNGFQNWSGATVNLTNTSPVHSGTYAIGVTDGGNSQALVFEHPDFNTSLYTYLSFWINGGSSGGQKVQVSGLLDGTSQSTYSLGALPANTWQQVNILLASLGVGRKPNCTGFEIQGNNGGAAQPTFYVDDVQLVAASAPPLVHLAIDAAHALQTVDARQFGINIGTWDDRLTNAQTLPQLEASGCLNLRWPGGSTSDGYHWASDPTGNATFRNIATNLGAQVFTTVNYGTGTPGEAAAWVLSANKTNNCGFKYWEIGNECYGTWEIDSNAVPHDPYTYATNAAACIQQMKAAYPAVPIHVGIVVTPGEGSYSNNATHFAINPRTGTTNYGWTPIVLSELKSLGVMPDFLIYHFYWQYTTYGWTPYSESADSDALLLQVAGNPCPVLWSDWASAAADLRQQISDYLGPAGTNIELCVTENNSDAGAMGRQSTSLVNALYLADSTSQLLKTEFRSSLFWDFQNDEPSAGGDYDPTIYGWRGVGDYGIVDGSNNPYPAFYAEKLLQYFARPGDSVLNGTSDSLLLSVYAVHRTNGALTMLVINKDMTTNLNAQIVLTNFVPWTTATIQSYGIPQDQAAQTNAGAAQQDITTTNFPIAGTNFTCSFPPLSLTLFTFAPAASALSVSGLPPGQVQLLLQGQRGTPYVIQSSPDLTAWTSVATNLLMGSTSNITILVSPGSPRQFYRAVWQP
ncbi:MAG TPA: alpha-L-arabinofuranosidase [Verrucomicrobiae bacterium]|nr:alpha-L-arabinofuranosidase [Verrucomicrobiae bacterium]